MESASLFPSSFTILLTTLVIIGVLKVTIVIYNHLTYWKKKGIAYINTFQIFGITWRVLLRRISIFEQSQWFYNYDQDAKYLGLMDMSAPTVLIRDPDLIRDIMVKNFEHFPDHRSFMDENIDPFFSKNIFSLRGNRWKEMRNTLSPTFTASKMKFMFELISKCSNEFVEYLAAHPEECASIDTKEAFRRYTTDVIATSAFGISVDSMKDRENEFFRRGRDVIQTFSSPLRFTFFMLCPKLAKAVGLTFFSPSVPKFFKRIVGETIKVREDQGILRPDMIHLLMQARNKEGQSVHDITLDDIVAQAFLFFVAGFETTATLMCFVVHELAVNRDVQDRLWQEVKKNYVEGNGQISYEAMSKMVYMDMVVSETLRKYPAVLFIDRQCVKSYELPPSKPGLKSIILEPDNMVFAPVYAIHHDPKFFPNPYKFDPERFSDENKDNIVPYTYMPFGHGPRKCIGNRFALMETKLLVASLLRRFIFKPSEKTVEPLVFDKSQFNLTPVGGFWVELEKREN